MSIPDRSLIGMLKLRARMFVAIDAIFGPAPSKS
jgi:hypothetical protein